MSKKILILTGDCAEDYVITSYSIHYTKLYEYEEEVDNIIGNYRMIALCTYCLEKCNSTEIVDVVINHQFALIKREGKWEQIESSKRKRAEETALQAAKDWKYTFDAVPDLIAIIDTEYRVVRANRSYNFV